METQSGGGETFRSLFLDGGDFGVFGGIEIRQQWPKKGKKRMTPPEEDKTRY